MKYKFPDDFEVHESFVNLMLKNWAKITDAVMERTEAITREKQGAQRERWRERFGPDTRFHFMPAKSHLLQAIRESGQVPSAVGTRLGVTKEDEPPFKCEMCGRPRAMHRRCEYCEVTGV